MLNVNILLYYKIVMAIPDKLLTELDNIDRCII